MESTQTQSPPTQEHPHRHAHAPSREKKPGLRRQIRSRYLKALHRSPAFSNYRATVGEAFWKETLVGVAALGLAVVVGVVAAPSTGRVLIAAALGATGIGVLGFVLKRAVDMRQGQARRQRYREQVLAAHDWRGDEQVLDVGCGSGMLLTACAGKLTTGRATGIDVWNRDAGSGTEAVLWKNARAEGVADRIVFLNMDARKMTFDDDSFNLVTASWSFHHIGTSMQEFRDVLAGMVRVLKPGGTLVIIDVAPLIDLTEGMLAEMGLADVERRNEGGFGFLIAHP